nr:hypothetical protein Iba_chr06cCG1110 [Ipomoea batatas]
MQKDAIVLSLRDSMLNVFAPHGPPGLTRSGLPGLILSNSASNASLDTLICLRGREARASVTGGESKSNIRHIENFNQVIAVILKRLTDSLAVLCGCSDSQMYQENIQCPVMFKNELCAVHYINGKDKSKLKCVEKNTVEMHEEDGGYGR